MALTELGAEQAGAVVYRSHVNVQARPGGLKLVGLPATSQPVAMGMHGEIAAHYKLSEGSFTPCASTLDYVVGAAAGCLAGTLNRALAQQKIPTGNGQLQVEAVGEIENEKGVLVIRRIRVIAHLRADSSRRAEAEQIIASYAEKCPVYRSLCTAIAITTELDFQPAAA